MLVADVTNWYAPNSGGIRTYLDAKAAWAARENRRHALIVPARTAGERRVARSSLIELRGRTPTDRWGYRVMLNGRWIEHALDRLSADVVVLHDPLAFPRTLSRWTSRQNAPLVYFCHSLPRTTVAGMPRAVAGPLGAFLGRAHARALASADLVMTPSASMAPSLRRAGGAPVTVAPLGVDVALFRGARRDPTLRGLVPAGVPLIVYAGRLSPEKRVELLIEMLPRIGQPAVLAIAGAGLAEPRLRRAAERRGVADRVHFLGQVERRSDMAALLASADCFVHPNAHEPFGLAPLEALAAGCRVVAPDAGGCRANLRGRGAILVAPNSAAALATGVRRALERPAATPDLDGLDRDERFAEEWSAYEDLVGRRR